MQELAKLAADYRSGQLLTGELKAICIKYLQEYVAGFQERRGKVTEEIVNEFMSARPLEWKGNPKVPRADIVVPVAKDDAAGQPGDGEISKSELKRIAKQKQVAEKKAAKAAEKEAKAAEGS